MAWKQSMNMHGMTRKVPVLQNIKKNSIKGTIGERTDVSKYAENTDPRAHKIQEFRKS